MRKETNGNSQYHTSPHHPSQSLHPCIHFFTSAPALPTPLVQQLNMRSFPYELHNMFKDMDLLLKMRNRNKKLMLLVEGSHQSKDKGSNFLFPKNYIFPQGQENVILRFYSLNPEDHRSQLQGIKAIIQFCQKQLRNESCQRVQFKSARSLSTSRPKTFRSHRSPQPVKKMQPPSYQQIFYQYSSSYQDVPGVYQLFCSSLENMEKAEPFDTYDDLILQIKGRNQKYLVLTGSKTVKQLLSRIKQQGVTHFDLILLGEAQPSTLYLDPSIVLATNDSDIVSQFISQNGFQFKQQPLQQPKLMQKCSMSSTDFRNIMKKVMKQDSQYSSNNIFRSTFRSGMCIQEKVVRYWQVQKDHQGNNQFVTTQIIDSNLQIAEFADQIKKRKNKNPGRSVFSQMTQQDQPQNHQQPLLTSMSKRSSAPFYNQVNLANTSQKPSSDKDFPFPNNMPDMASSQPVKAQTLIHPMFTYNQKNSNNYPSNIIHEVSEQYRGSNKSSMVYLQNNHSMRRQTPSQYYFESQKKSYRNSPSPINNKLSYTSGFQSSQQSIPSNQLAISQARIQSLNSIKGPPNLKIYSPSSEYISQKSNDSSSHHQITQKVIKKTQLTSPEEVKYDDIKTPEIVSTPSKQISSTNTRSNQKFTTPSTSKKEVNAIQARTPQRRGTQQIQSPKDQNKQNHMKRYSIAPTSSDKKIHPSFHNSIQRQFQGFQRVQKDGVVIYRRKQVHKETPQDLEQKAQNLQRKILSPVKPLPYQTANPMRIKNQSRQVVQKNQENDDLALMVESTNKKATTTADNSNSNGQEKTTISPAKSPYLSPPPVQRPSLNNGKIQVPKAFNAPKQRPAFGNQSMFSKISQLHSDGSILRRNNIRFGVKAPHKQQKIQPSMMLQQQSKLKSAIGKIQDQPIKKRDLSRLIPGQQKLSKQQQKLHHIDTKFNYFHYLIHQDLNYLTPMLQTNLLKKQDKIQTFANLQLMFQYIRPQKTQELFDAGFIVTIKNHHNLINPKILPKDYFLLVIDRSKGPLVQINQERRIVKVDSLSQLPLVQKIIIQAKIYHYVAYRSQKKEIVLLADKFMESDFVLQKIQTQFSSSILDFYYCQLPRLTRLYILCTKQEVQQLCHLLKIYQEFNPSFNPKSVKIICLISNILENDELIMSHSGVTFVNNPEDLKNYWDIIAYAHYQDNSSPCFPIDHFFYHHKYSTLEMRLENTFPGRFQPIPYLKLADVYPKVEKLIKAYNKKGVKNNNYLLLPQNIGGERLSTQHFSKIYMIGKGKSIQSSIMRVINIDQLIQKLRF